MASQLKTSSIELQRCVRQRALAGGTGRGSLQVVGAVKRVSLKNVICSKTLKAKEKYLEKLKRECRSMSEHAQKEMNNSESGILSFEVFQDPFEEKQIHFFERYADNTRMGRFNSSARFTKFMKDVQRYIEEPVGLALYEWQDGQIGASSMQGGPKGEGGLDDATGASGMASGAAYKQTSDVVNLGNVEREPRKGWADAFNFPWNEKK